MKKIYMILAAITLLSMSLNAQTTYVKVTSADQLTDGEYLIVCENQNVILNGSLSAFNGANSLAAPTINNGVIEYTADLDNQDFTIDMTKGTVKSASGYYIGCESGSNAITFNQTTEYENTISVSNGVASIIYRYNNANRPLKCNTTNKNFRYYKSTSGDVADIQLYKKVESTPPTPTPELTAPENGSTVNVGTTSAELPSVSKEIPISGNYLTKDLTATITGEGFSFLTRDITVPYADVNAATASVTVVYNGTDENATGTLTLSSDEVSAVVNLTASYRKPAVLTTVPAGYVVQDKKTPNQIVTAVIETTVDLYHGEVVSVTYVNSLGMTSDKPFEGVNIVITRYSDGTTSTSKVMQ